MSQFDISIAKVRAAVAEIAAIAKQIKSDGQRISSVESRLNMNGSYTAELHSRLKELTETRYDENSRPVLVLHPDGSKSLAEYDGRGNIVRVTDPAGAVTSFEKILPWDEGKFIDNPLKGLKRGIGSLTELFMDILWMSKPKKVLCAA